jgi:23S rRNA pseudouridine2604 synthase
LAWTKTFSGDEPQRVNKWLAAEGVCSRREAEALIEQGAVAIDGTRVSEPGHKIAPGQTLTLTRDEEAPATYVLHKPVGLVSSQPEADQIPAARLLTKANLFGAPAPAPDSRTPLAPLGRLDMDSRGLLLLSLDGVLAKALIGPDSHLDKEYLVRFEGTLTPRALDLLRHGLELDGRRLRPAKVNPAGAQRLNFMLREGRKRQIRRMCEAVGLEVTDLYRVRIGPLRLGELPEGKWRILTTPEREALIAGAKA